VEIRIWIEGAAAYFVPCKNRRKNVRLNRGASGYLEAQPVCQVGKTELQARSGDTGSYVGYTANR